MIRTIVEGAVAGLAATAPMTCAMEYGARQLPLDEQYPLPPRLITMKIAQQAGIRDDLSRNQKRVLTLFAHAGYGATMGTIYALTTNGRNTGAKAGALYGLGVWAGSYLGWLPAVGVLKPVTEQPVRRTALMIGAHLVWGATTGWLMGQMRNTNDTE